MSTVPLSRFSIIKELGKGGMATVYLATDRILNREVALKTMSESGSYTHIFKKEFLEEARKIASLEHPNIVRIFDIVQDDDSYYMAMEYINDGNLKQKMLEKKFSVKEVISIIQQLASALSYAHQKGYIHRDVKPANILFRKDGTIALADFGIAKLEGVVSELTKIGLVPGTPHYMAPEQTLGQVIDKRADLYSLGVVFYELLTNKKPYVGESDYVIAYNHQHASLPKLIGDHAIFEPILHKALAKNPKDRYESIEQFSNALTNLHKEKESIQPRSRKIFFWLSLVLMIGLGLGLIIYYIVLDSKHKEVEHQMLRAKIGEHLEIAKESLNRDKFFDQSAWTAGCKLLLVDTFGPYDPQESAEWHYKEIIKLDKDNESVKKELEKIANKKNIDFSSCDNYRRAGVDNSEIDELFEEAPKSAQGANAIKQ